MDKRPIAFVVQRYGPEVIGGAEALCRAMAEGLSRARPVEVLTTCASDYMTWKNEYAEGASTINDVTVRRFRVDYQRTGAFHKALNDLLVGFPMSAYDRHRRLLRAMISRSTPEQQLACLKLEGPYSSGLLDFLGAHHGDYGLVVFVTYLYPTTYFGSLRVPRPKTVLVPTAHDEVMIFLPLFREMFARFPAHVFLTVEERRFVEEVFSIDRSVRITAGMPVDLPGTPDADRFRQKYAIDGPFVLYAGRLDTSKGCDDLVNWFRSARSQWPEGLKLLLIGSRMMDLPADRHIRHLGQLSEQDKADAMAAASVFVNPSPFESFSIVVLEAMLAGTPVLVNGRCDVLRSHVERSRAGLYYETPYEFVEALRLLLEDGRLRARMGANGAAYALRNYSPDVVRERYLAFLEQVEARAAEQMTARTQQGGTV